MSAEIFRFSKFLTRISVGANRHASWLSALTVPFGAVEDVNAMLKWSIHSRRRRAEVWNPHGAELVSIIARRKSEDCRWRTCFLVIPAVSYGC
jgi:hypothetical protein